MTSIEVQIRRSSPSDRDPLLALQHNSMRVLGRACYDDDVIETFIKEVGTLDERLIEDGTFFSALVGETLVGCGGWTLRTPSYASHMQPDAVRGLRPMVTIRSVFVDPAFARQGIARRIMAEIEADIVAAGYERASLGATLNAIPLYRMLGYRSGAPVVLRLPGDLTFVGLGMDKHLARSRSMTAAA